MCAEQVLWLRRLQHGESQDRSCAKVADGARRTQAADASRRRWAANRKWDSDAGDSTTAQGLSAAEQAGDCLVKLWPPGSHDAEIQL